LADLKHTFMADKFSDNSPSTWSPLSWQTRPESQRVEYPDPAAIARAIATLGALPPLVTSWEIERLKSQLADAQDGKRFLLHGGDCAERIDECTPEALSAKLKILLQMSLVLIQGGKRPVIRVGRFAGQYAKPRSSPIETRTINGTPISLPSYFGDLYNHPEFTPQARLPDPHLMVRGYERAAATLNFIRSLSAGGFADLHHPEYWNLAFFKHASLSPERRAQYEQMVRDIAAAVEFMEAVGEQPLSDTSRVEFFTSHEGLNLLYESAQTRSVPRREGIYNLTTHLPWIGERTRQLNGAHVEYFRGIANPIGIKIGPKCSPDELVALADVLNPKREKGKLVIILRLGAGKAQQVVAGFVSAMQAASHPVLWVSDPMHGNGIVAANGIKTRSFDTIAQELQEVATALVAAGARLGGVHFELTGDDVTECVGGASGITEANLHTNYSSVCDPRLNYAQALEIAFMLASRLAADAPRRS
jgi:3-deoxy-7-phosphoheptulonate synthase